MIIVKLWGGMCNQMFQYAFGYALARKHNDDLAFDVDFYKNQPGHVGKRKVISIKDFSLTNLHFIERPIIARYIENKYINHLIRYSKGCDFTFKDTRYVVEPLHHFYPEIPYTKKKRNYYDGYWQSWKYFDEYADLIRKELQPSSLVGAKVEAWKAALPQQETVSVHIRRGDYLNKKNQGKDTYLYNSTEYYHRAVNEIKKRVSNPYFCFFSDDIEWCKREFSYIAAESEFVINSGNAAAVVDLFSIAACKHGILSPSSFSWWGNWLKKSNKESIIIAPKQKDINPYLNPKNWFII